MDICKDLFFAWAKLVLIEGKKNSPSSVVLFGEVRPIIAGFGRIKLILHSQ